MGFWFVGGGVIISVSGGRVLGEASQGAQGDKCSVVDATVTF